MAKTRTSFVCRTCGGVQSRWLGKCPDCGSWDSLERFTPAAASATKGGADGELAEGWLAEEGDAAVARRAAPLDEVEPPAQRRVSTAIGELDRVLGGGLVAGSAVLLGGDPGIGKSTLLLQAAGNIARGGGRVLYVSSEESAYQTRLRAERLFGPVDDDDASFLKRLLVMADTDLARVGEQARRIRPSVMIVDSIQMVHASRFEGAAGSVTQLRRCCMELVGLAKVSGMAVIVVGHVTKDGQLAGPKLLEHLVDAVLSFEGDRFHAHRVVRGIKNRFGTTLEVGLFEMTARGLEEIDGAAGLAPPDRDPRPGTVVCPAMQGTRAMLVEVQALTSPGVLGNARRRTSGLDPNRLAVLIAVLEQHAGLRLADQDVFCSTVGGLRVGEPAADLALCLAIGGAHRRRGLPAGTAVIGEVGLGGEVRRVPQLEVRMRECERLGYRTIVAPPMDDGITPARSTTLRVVETIDQALEVLDAAPSARIHG